MKVVDPMGAVIIMYLNLYVLGKIIDDTRRDRILSCHFDTGSTCVYEELHFFLASEAYIHM